jgi:murein DD-endopeptidase MepM/ murein hydrolase activator NlpD
MGFMGFETSTANGTDSGLKENTALAYENENLNEISKIYGSFITELYPVITGKNVDFSKLPSDSIRKCLDEILAMYPNISPIKTADSIHVSSKFGWRISPTTKRKQFHRGIDINMPLHTDIHSTMSGKVVEVKYTTKNTYGQGYGNYIVIRNSLGFETLYAHLSKISVKKGQQVNKGQLVGTVGITGNATGPNLHYEILQGGELKDPMSSLFIKYQNTLTAEK